MANNPIEGLISTAMENLKTIVDANTIIGEAVKSDDGMTVIPVSKVSFGFGAGGAEFKTGKDEKEEDAKNFGGGAGGGVTISPIAFLVVGQEKVKLIPVGSSSNAADKIAEAIPELLSKFGNMLSSFKDKKKSKETKKGEVKIEEKVVLED
ncbi:MAG: sporulation protein YtfJ [Ruminococcaceae bacterium]|nr:sporulation protein YtfJ [Oscillospiraceae bacterium]